MTLTVKTSRGSKYLYFQAGNESLYIAPKNNPSRAKMDNVVKALDHVRGRIDHHEASFDDLLDFLPPKERRRYTR